MERVSDLGWLRKGMRLMVDSYWDTDCESDGDLSKPEELFYLA
jgi:hypothetical protein